MSRTRIAIAMIAILAVVAGLTTILVAVILESNKPTTSPTQTTTTPTTDPYDEYLKIAPPNAPELSREDAQTRATLGCEKKWAPGTVDAALQKAYGDLVCQ